MRRRKNYRSRLRKESRTIPLYGDADRGNGLDDGRYYRCWNCGFVCNIDRDALGDSESRDGLHYEDFPVPVYGADTAVENSEIARLGGSVANQTLVAVWEESQVPGNLPYPGQITPGGISRSLSTEYYARRHPTENAGFLNRRPMMIGISIMPMMGLWYESNVIKDRYEIKPVVDSGCPFCGSLNWKGEY